MPILSKMLSISGTDDSVDEYAEIYARERDDEGVSHRIMEYGIITLEDGDITIYQTEVKKN
jgi:hypothetical protein